MFENLDPVARRYEDMEYRLTLPETLADPAAYQRLIREYNALTDTVTAYRAFWRHASMRRRRKHSHPMRSCGRLPPRRRCR